MGPSSSSNPDSFQIGGDLPVLIIVALPPGELCQLSSSLARWLAGFLPSVPLLGFVAWTFVLLPPPGPQLSLPAFSGICMSLPPTSDEEVLELSLLLLSSVDFLPTARELDPPSGNTFPLAQLALQVPLALCSLASTLWLYFKPCY